MRLLETRTLKLVEKTPEEMHKENIRYAILSHTWGPDEVVYHDIVEGTEGDKAPKSRLKVQNACAQALVDGYQYIWIDTCCIDKSSSAELSEAINSMYAWYRDAAQCYAFLEGAPATLDTAENKDEFRDNRWFMRGWTLQELLAPASVVFFSGTWQFLGEKKTISPLLANITGIEDTVLTGEQPVNSASVAKRMSWAARRQTTRPEDSAYCLMGMFGVNMPMLYGEGGEGAFLRLQEEIMKHSDDQSLFAWADLDAPADEPRGLLAISPAAFVHSTTMLPYHDWEPREPYSMTNRGLRIQLHLTARNDGLFVAALDCPVPPDYKDSSFLAIYLRKLSGNDGDAGREGQHYARVHVGSFGSVQQRGKLSTIYVRQDQQRPIDEGVFPHHILQLRNGPSTDIYKVIRVLLPPSDGTEITNALSLRQSARSWVPKPWPLAFPLLKGAGQVAAAVVFERDDGERLAILIGAVGGFQVAFDALELGDEEYGRLEDLVGDFQPSVSGRFEREYHSVRVSVKSVVQGSSKYYFIDIGIENIQRSTRFEDLLEATDEWLSHATGTGNRQKTEAEPVTGTVPQEQAENEKPTKGSKFWRRWKE